MFTRLANLHGSHLRTTVRDTRKTVSALRGFFAPKYWPIRTVLANIIVIGTCKRHAHVHYYHTIITIGKSTSTYTYGFSVADVRRRPVQPSVYGIIPIFLSVSSMYGIIPIFLTGDYWEIIETN